MIDSISTIYGLLPGSFCNNLLNSATGRPDHYELPGKIRAGTLDNSAPARLTSNQLVTHQIQSPATACPAR